MKKLTISRPALKEENGKVDPAPSKAWSHSELEAADHLPDKKVKRGFVTNTGEFVDRKKAAKIAKAAGEIKKRVKKLHSSDLRRAMHIKKKELK
jgi:hypothetical protein